MHAFETLCEPGSLHRHSQAQQGREVLVPLRKLGRKDAVTPASKPSEPSMLPRLCKLLCRLPPSKRRSVLQTFSQQQRLLLERWMLAKQPKSMTVEKEASPLKRSRTLQNVCLRKRVQSVVRVTRNRKYRYYLASAAVGDGLRLITRTVCSLEAALNFHAVLVVIKKRTLLGTGSLDSRFRDALRSTFFDFRMDPDDMGLKFIVGLRVLWMKSPLRTPAYLVASQLDAGLQALQRLHKARGYVKNYVLRSVSQGELEKRWEQIRGEYLDIMIEAGCERQAVSNRLDVLDRERNSKLQEQASRWLSQGDDQSQSWRLSATADVENGSRDMKTMRRIESLLSRWNQGAQPGRKPQRA
ncbi:unnamed protein product [Effrenium voratum]|nr:unnamed protein product [Effrenium voratum]